MTGIENIESYLLRKTFRCPVCETEFKSPVIRHGKCRLVSADSDTKQNYTPVDPLYYDIVVCTKCGYAVSSSSFEKPVHEKTAERIQKLISPRYGNRENHVEMDLDDVLERYRIALECMEIRRVTKGEHALMLLKIAWVCRSAKKEALEQEYLRKAADEFAEAFQSEKPPIVGMGTYQIMYLVGELERRTGNTDEAMRWFSRIITSQNAESRIKDRAREQKDLIKGATERPEPKEEPKPKKFKLFG